MRALHLHLGLCIFDSLLGVVRCWFLHLEWVSGELEWRFGVKSLQGVENACSFVFVVLL
jgi:hypothetical protein